MVAGYYALNCGVRRGGKIGPHGCVNGVTCRQTYLEDVFANWLFSKANKIFSSLALDDIIGSTQMVNLLSTNSLSKYLGINTPTD